MATDPKLGVERVSGSAFLQALREEMDAATHAAVRTEARTLARLRNNTWCPTDEQVDAEMDCARALVSIGANGCGDRE